MSPQGKFEAWQTSDGHALLFAISTSGVFSVVAESSGTSRTGWVDTDLSTVIVQEKFPGATVRPFDVGQSALDGIIGLAIAVSSGGSDHLSFLYPILIPTPRGSPNLVGSLILSTLQTRASLPSQLLAFSSQRLLISSNISS